MPWDQICWVTPASTPEALARHGPPEHLLLGLYQYLQAGLIERREGKQQALDAIAGSAARMLDSELLQEIAARQARLLSQRQKRGYRLVIPNRFQLESNLTCGRATSNLVERGMTLSRPQGLPIVPASSVKGAIAAHLAAVVTDKLYFDDRERQSVLARPNLTVLFGKAAQGEALPQPSGAMFFDALPEVATVSVDVTTPHYARYYQGKEAAATGFECPIPLPFLTVEAGSVFLFPILVAPDIQWTPPAELDRRRLRAFGITHFDRPEDFLADALASAARYKGFGSQTNVCYGRFVSLSPSRL